MPNPEMRMFISAFCKRPGMLPAETPESGEVALEWLLLSPVDPVPSDYRFPQGMDGIPLLRRLYTCGDTTPFILFAAGIPAISREKAAKNGLSGVVSRARQGKNPVLTPIRTVCRTLTNMDSLMCL